MRVFRLKLRLLRKLTVDSFPPLRPRLLHQNPLRWRSDFRSFGGNFLNNSLNLENARNRIGRIDSLQSLLISKLNMEDSGKKTMLIVLHGLPAAGKYTIGKELHAILEQQDREQKYKFFHNHLVVDAVISLFPFGSENFRKYREQIWLSLIPAAIEENSNVIFTFSPDTTVSEDYPQKLEEAVQKVGGKLIGIKIKCSDEEIDRRMSTREEFEKLKDVKLYHELKKNGAFDFPHFPIHYELDSTLHSPQEIADLVAKYVLSQ